MAKLNPYLSTAPLQQRVAWIAQKSAGYHDGYDGRFPKLDSPDVIGYRYYMDGYNAGQQDRYYTAPVIDGMSMWEIEHAQDDFAEWDRITRDDYEPARLDNDLLDDADDVLDFGMTQAEHDEAMRDYEASELARYDFYVPPGSTADEPNDGGF